MLYSDPEGKIEKMLKPGGPPELAIQDEYGVSHQLWHNSDPALIESVRNQMQDRKLIIADGHHRYETALNYRNECRDAKRLSEGISQSGGSYHDAAHEFVMMTFVNMDSPGLIVLPTHRVVHSLTQFSAERFREAASPYFEIQEIPGPFEPGPLVDKLREAGRRGTALLAIMPNRALLLHAPKANDDSLFAGISARQQSLDVVQLHKCVLERVLDISEEAIREQQNVAYVRDAGEAIARVLGGTANLAFLLNPAPIEQVRDIAFAGEVLPQKSTDFYPKLLSGLTIYALE